MASFVTVFQRLEALGLTDVLLPFILIFSVVFAILSAVNILKQRNINIIVALSIALLVVVPHVTGSYPAGSDVVEIINSSIPNVMAVVIAVVMMMILIGVFGVRFKLKESPLGGIIAIAALIGIILIFGSSAGWFGRSGSFSGIFSFLNDSDTVMVILVLLIFGLIVAFITHEPPDPNNKFDPGEFLKTWIGTGLENVNNEEKK